MIRVLPSAPRLIESPKVTEEERAASIASQEQFQLNLKWWNAHVAEIRAAHTGKYVCVAGQELFVGDDPIEVEARAKAAHPYPGYGFLSLYLSPLRGPKIHAHQRRLV
jgi:hypothetical protein